MATVSQSARAAAPHPCALQLIVNDKLHLVVGMKGQDPVYRNGEKLKRYRAKAHYEVSRARSYLTDTFIEIKDIKGSEILDDNGTRGGVTLSLVANQTLQGAFIIVIAHNTDFIRNGVSPDATYFVRPLPDLPKGEEVKVSLVTMGSMMGYNHEWVAGGRSFFPIIFAAGGQEVRTSWNDKVATYYSDITHLKHMATKASYLKEFADADHPVVPFSMPAPVLPQRSQTPRATVNALLEVDVTGSVVSVALDTKLESAIESAVHEALLEWLFMPKLVAGSPVRSRVEVPLNL